MKKSCCVSGRLEHVGTASDIFYLVDANHRVSF